MINQSVYVIIGIDDGRVKECLVVTDLSDAQTTFEYLKTIYGGANVALVSRAINDHLGCEGCKHTKLLCSACLKDPSRRKYDFIQPDVLPETNVT